MRPAAPTSSNGKRWRSAIRVKARSLIRHTAVGLNFIDVYHRTGLYTAALPSGIGLEAAGVVEAVGEGVTEFAAGDRVAYGTGPIGAYSEARLIAADKLVKFPEGVEDRTGCRHRC